MPTRSLRLLVLACCGVVACSAPPAQEALGLIHPVQVSGAEEAGRIFDRDTTSAFEVRGETSLVVSLPREADLVASVATLEPDRALRQRDPEGSAVDVAARWLRCDQGASRSNP